VNSTEIWDKLNQLKVQNGIKTEEKPDWI